MDCNRIKGLPYIALQYTNTRAPVGQDGRTSPYTGLPSLDARFGISAFVGRVSSIIFFAWRGRGAYPSSVSASSFTLSITITLATSHASTVTQTGMTKTPIFRLSETKRTSGMTANGSCIDRIT